MNIRRQRPFGRLRNSAGGMFESLEPRCYLSGVAAPMFVAPTGDFAVSAPTGTFPASVVAGSMQNGGATVVITYNGTATLTNAVVTTTLYASATQLHDASAVQIGTAVTERIGTLKPGTTLKIHFASFAYPKSAGAQYLVADVALNGALDSYDGATSMPINVQAPFIDAVAIAATSTKTIIVAQKPATALFTIKNIGNIAIASGATVDVGYVPAGSPAGTTPTPIALAVPVTLHLNAGQTGTLRVNFTPTTLPTTGSYDLVLQINVAGDALTSNDTVFSTALQAPFIDAVAIAATPTKTIIVAQKPATALFTIKNVGNIAIASGATVDVGYVPAGSPAGTTPTPIALAVPVTLHLNAGQTGTLRVNFTPTTLPTTGSYDLVLQINVAGDVVTSNDTVFSTALEAPFVDAVAIAATPTKTIIVAQKPATALFTIKNVGNIAIASGATVDVGVVPAGSPAGTTPTPIALAVPVTLQLNTGQTGTLRVNFTPTTLPTTGSYDLVLQINLAGDAVTSNDTVFSTALIMI